MNWGKGNTYKKVEVDKYTGFGKRVARKKVHPLMHLELHVIVLTSQWFWRTSTEGGTVGVIALENYSPNHNKKPKRQSDLLRFRRRRGRFSGNGPLCFHRRPLQRKRTPVFLLQRPPAKGGRRQTCKGVRFRLSGLLRKEAAVKFYTRIERT